MVFDRLSQPIPREERRRLYLYKIAALSPNVRFMDYLLNFIEDRFQLLPRESPSRQICFRPQFTAFVSANKTKGGLHVSLLARSFSQALFNARSSRTGASLLSRIRTISSQHAAS